MDETREETRAMLVHNLEAALSSAPTIGQDKVVAVVDQRPGGLTTVRIRRKLSKEPSGK